VSAVGPRLAAFLLAPEPRPAHRGGGRSAPDSAASPAAVGLRVSTWPPVTPHPHESAGSPVAVPARRPGHRAPRRRRVPVRAPVLTAGVLGDEGAAALAGDVATLLARRARVRAALVVVWGGPAPGPRGSATQRTAELAADLQGATGLVARTGTHAVIVELPAGPEPAATAFAALRVAAGDAVPVVFAVCGPRPAALDPALAGQELLVATVAADAPAGFLDTALRSLRAAAPDARVLTVTRPPGGVPRALRHRVAMRQIAEVLDA
jgi:hypothetical protein